MGMADKPANGDLQELGSPFHFLSRAILRLALPAGWALLPGAFRPFAHDQPVLGRSSGQLDRVLEIDGLDQKRIGAQAVRSIDVAHCDRAGQNNDS